LGGLTDLHSLMFAKYAIEKEKEGKNKIFASAPP
jgi:hypothetical protein